MHTVALDCMGGDHGIGVTLPAAGRFLVRHPEARLVLVGQRERIEPALAGAGLRLGDQVRVVHAEQVVAMDEPPAQALRGKRASSMRRAIDLVQAGEADACVSAGNTGALMAMARFVLKTLPGVERPAIASWVPTLRGRACVLDLGANVDCQPVHLLQFAVMGAALFTAVDGKPNPSVGLLNIGEEEIKGNEVVKQAGELLRASSLNYHGNVEGDDIYKGTTDVVVCDGFVGNVFLKASEGMARMLASYLRDEFHRNIFARLSGLAALPVIRSFRNRVDPRRYNGASLVGLRGVVVKSHGSADSFALEVALDRAYDEARGELLRRICEQLGVPAGGDAA